MRVPGLGAILEYRRRFGWRVAVARGAYVAVNRVATVSVLDCFRMRPQDINTALTECDARWECRFMDAGETDSIAAQCEGGLGRLLPEAILRGDLAYIVLDDGRLASIGLYASQPAPVLHDLTVHFDPHSRYMYRGYTNAAYRGLRLHALGILRAARALFDRGVPQLVTICERTNHPALVSVLRMGWQPCGTLYRVGISRWMRLGSTGSARAAGMRLERRSPEES